MSFLAFIVGWVLGGAGMFLACWTTALGVCTLYELNLLRSSSQTAALVIQTHGLWFIISSALCVGAFQLWGWAASSFPGVTPGLVAGAIFPGVFALSEIPRMISGAIAITNQTGKIFDDLRADRRKPLNLEGAVSLCDQEDREDDSDDHSIYAEGSEIRDRESPALAPAVIQEILSHPDLRSVGPEERLRMIAQLLQDREGLGRKNALEAAMMLDDMLVSKREEETLKIIAKYPSEIHNACFSLGLDLENDSTRQEVSEKLLEIAETIAWDPRIRLGDELSKMAKEMKARSAEILPREDD